MKQVGVVIIVVFAVLLLDGITVGQSRSRLKPKSNRATPTPSPTPRTLSDVKQSVSIKLKNGDLIIGDLLHRDSQSIQVDLVNGPRTIKVGDIETLTFVPKETPAAKPAPAAKANPETAGQPAPSPDVMMAHSRKAYTALRKLSAAAQIGLPYPQYSSMLIETKAAVDETLSTLPENAIKADLAAAMEAYVDAGQAWGAAQALPMPPGQAVVGLLIAGEPGATLMKKYAIKPAVNALGQEDRLMLDTTLATIWAAATTHLNNVGPMLKM
jgi:hypothetical protein